MNSGCHRCKLSPMSESVAELLQGELRRLNWVQADLGRVLSWSTQTISEVMQGKRRIDAAMAVDLEAVTTIPAYEWLSAQALHELSALDIDAKTQARSDRIRQRARLEKAAPIRELLKRGALSDSDSETQEGELKELFEVEDLDDDPPYLSNVSAKRSMAGTALTRQQKAWIALGRRQASGVTVSDYDRAEFLHFAARLPRQVRQPEDFLPLPDQFAEIGVRLVHTPAFPGGRIDAVSLRLIDSPLIILSGRGKRFDRVLFALLHECAHIALGHWEQGFVQVHESGAVGDPAVEQSVNSLASEWIAPHGLNLPPVINHTTISELAERHGVSRALIIGQLQHVGLLAWGAPASRGLPKVEEELMTWS